MTSVFGSILLPFFIGIFLLLRLLLRVSIPYKVLLIVSLSFPLGAALLSLLLFYSYLAAGGNGPALTVTLAVLTLVLLGTLMAMEKGSLWKSPAFQARFLRMRLTSLSRPLMILTVLFAFLFCLSFVRYWNYFWNEAFSNFAGGWDARYFWNLKARFYFREPSLWKGMFSPLFDQWGHPDYPLMLPGIVAWGWISAGREFFLWPMSVSFFFALSLVLLVFWYLLSFSKAPAAFAGAAYLMSIPAFHFWSSTQYADIPLSFFFTSSALLFLCAYRTKQLPLLILSGLMAGLSIWTKDEGYLFTAASAAVIILLSSFQAAELKEKMKWLLSYALAASLGASASLLIKTSLGTTGGQYAGSGRSFADFLRLVFAEPEKTLFISKAFGSFLLQHGQWNGLWILFAAALILGGKAAFSEKRWTAAFMTGAVLTGYFIIIHITPHDVVFQIQTALIRLMLHTAPLALIYAVETLCCSFPERKISN